MCKGARGPQWLGLSQAESRSQELDLDLSCGRQGLENHYCCAVGLCESKMLKSRVELGLELRNSVQRCKYSKYCVNY